MGENGRKMFRPYGGMVASSSQKIFQIVLYPGSDKGLHDMLEPCDAPGKGGVNLKAVKMKFY
jgi:hypothetical protein